jgi:hypothetical protein
MVLQFFEAALQNSEAAGAAGGLAWLGYCIVLEFMRRAIEELGRGRFGLPTPAMSRLLLLIIIIQ